MLRLNGSKKGRKWLKWALWAIFGMVGAGWTSGAAMAKECADVPREMGQNAEYVPLAGLDGCWMELYATDGVYVRCQYRGGDVLCPDGADMGKKEQ